MFLAVALAASTLLQTPAAQTVGIVDRAFTGKPTELVVLGTAHLSELGPKFTPARLEPLLARLERWQPAAITIEAGNGRDCDDAKARPDLFGAEPTRTCQAAFAARNALGLNQNEAEQALEAALREPAQRKAADRRRLAALFLAAGEPGSALVQWLRLAPDERREGDGLNADAVAALKRYEASPNENFTLGARLGARLGLERLHPIDDKSGGRHVMALGPAYGNQLSAIRRNPAAKQAAAKRERATATFLSGGDVLAWYRWLNAPATLSDQMHADFAAAAAHKSPDQAGRLYLAYWETRNLRMVGNIRFAFGDRPGVRVLSIVGSSHKPYFERYFSTQSDVRLVEVERLLR